MLDVVDLPEVMAKPTIKMIMMRIMKIRAIQSKVNTQISIEEVRGIMIK